MTEACSFCGGIGAFITNDELEERFVVQRCDTCKKYSGDVAAYKALKPFESLEVVDNYE